jgi:hypothetical protein
MLSKLPKNALPLTLKLTVEFKLPATVRLVNVPTLVIFGCAAVVIVPAVVALLAVATVPDILPAGILVKLAPLPSNSVAFNLPVFLLNVNALLPLAVPLSLN